MATARPARAGRAPAASPDGRRAGFGPSPPPPRSAPNPSGPRPGRSRLLGAPADGAHARRGSVKIKRREQLLLARPAAGYILQHQDGAGSVTGLQVNATDCPAAPCHVWP
ncbi:uncharacterized protein LOC124417707 isoform X1 [Gallus gallus]|nr:uncharacterized protein LOC124417707 isoform X1 [Gallus gallus]